MPPLDIHDLINVHLELAPKAPDMTTDEWVDAALDLLLRLQHKLEPDEFSELNGLIVLASKGYYLAMLREADHQVEAMAVTDAIIARIKRDE